MRCSASRSADLRTKAGRPRNPSSDCPGRHLGTFDQDIGGSALELGTDPSEGIPLVVNADPVSLPTGAGPPLRAGARSGQAGVNGLPWPGHHERGTQGQQLGPRRLEELLVGGQGVDGGAVGRPPQVGARDKVGVRLHQGGDVFGRVARRCLEADRRTELEAVGIPLDPQVVLVDGPVVVEAGLGEQGSVQCVVGVVVAENHVGHLAGINSEGGQGIQDKAAAGHHARVDHDDGVAVADQHHRARHPVVRIPLGQNVESCRHGTSESSCPDSSERTCHAARPPGRTAAGTRRGIGAPDDLLARTGLAGITL